MVFITPALHVLRSFLPSLRSSESESESESSSTSEEERERRRRRRKEKKKRRRNSEGSSKQRYKIDLTTPLYIYMISSYTAEVKERKNIRSALDTQKRKRNQVRKNDITQNLNLTFLHS